MASLAQWVVIVFGAWLIGVSVFMLLRPVAALELLGKAASTNLINYGEITLRLIAGAAMVAAAPISRAPAVLEVAGYFIAATSAMLYLVPRRWHAKYAQYWSAKLTPVLLRLAAPFSLVAGSLLIYVLVPG